MKFSKQDLQDLIAAIEDAQDELCTGEGFPEATAIDARWEALEQRLRAELSEPVTRWWLA